MGIHLKIYEDASLCSDCGCVCCQKYPGTSLPDDWTDESGEVDWDKIEMALRSGLYVIDVAFPMNTAFNKMPRVRPADVLSDGVFDDKIKDGLLSCVFWREGFGCSMAAEDRPTGCTSLVPKPGLRCDWEVENFGKFSIGAWWPHRLRLLEMGLKIQAENEETEKVA